MPGRMNRFGCTALMVVTNFKTGSYDPTVADFGDSASVEAAIDSICDEIIQNMPEDMFLSLSSVDLEKIEVRAAANQTSVQLGLFPVIEDKTHVWANQPRWFIEKPRKQTDLALDDGFSDPEVSPTNELPSTAFTVDEESGEITLVNGLNVNDEVYATYEIDTDALVVDSLATLIAEGAAYLVGTKHFARGTSQWLFIDILQERYGKKLEALRDGDWLPPEIRKLKYWRERVPEADKKTQIQAGRLYRG